MAKGLCSAKRGKGPKDRASGRERANRRLPIGRALEESRRSGQAAVLQDAILRYSRLAVCATNTAEARNTYPAPVWSLDFFHVQWPGARVGRSDTGQKTRPIPAGATPQVKGPKNNPKRQRRGPILQIIERRMLVPHRVSNHSVEFARRMPAVAAKAGDRIPRVLCLGSKWNALSAL